MVDSLIPQSVRLKAGFEKTPRLIDDYEIAACIGLICQDLGEELPDDPELEPIRLRFLERSEVPGNMKKLLATRLADGKREDWRRLLEVGFRYRG